MTKEFTVKSVEELNELSRIYGLTSKDIIFAAWILSNSCIHSNIQADDPRLSKIFAFLSATTEVKK